jgi:hypothetical protein
MYSVCNLTATGSIVNITEVHHIHMGIKTATQLMDSDMCDV